MTATAFQTQLRMSAARDALAQCLFYARAQAYGLEPPHWDALSAWEKDTYRAEALIALKAVSPVAPARVTGLRATHGKVIGAIGVTR